MDTGRATISATSISGFPEVGRQTKLWPKINGLKRKFVSVCGASNSGAFLESCKLAFDLVVHHSSCSSLFSTLWCVVNVASTRESWG